MYTNVITNPYILYNSVTVYMVHIRQYIMQKVLSTACISEQFENEISSLDIRIPRLQRLLNRSDLRSKLGRIEYTKIHYGTGTRIFSGFGGFQYAVVHAC